MKKINKNKRSGDFVVININPKDKKIILEKAEALHLPLASYCRAVLLENFDFKSKVIKNLEGVKE